MNSTTVIPGGVDATPVAGVPVGGLPIPTDQDEIDRYRVEIDRIDEWLVTAVRRRTELSRAIGAARRDLGGPRVVYSRELSILRRFRGLGPRGTDLGLLLLELGRGSLGHALVPLPDESTPAASAVHA
ncbi:chorismate mutase [Nakamurella deserti]|uniref:chorismate mutase n=1 Tax=Nakamurella deserti TaxID=2164074 RepID=UPI000DBE4ADE|nr:chorismate mutase [Nakamurella deserti]